MWPSGFMAAEAKQAACCEGAMLLRDGLQTSFSNSFVPNPQTLKKKKISTMIWQVFTEFTGAGIAEIHTTASSRLSLDDCLAARNDVKV